MEPLINSHMVATVAWRDEMQGVARSQGLFSLTRDTTRQFASQAPPHAGCGQIGSSLSCTAWHRSSSYDLRRTRRDLPDLTRNATHGGINQWLLSVVAGSGNRYRVSYCRVSYCRVSYCRVSYLIFLK